MKLSLANKAGSGCLSCTNNMLYAEHPLSFLKSRILLCLGRGCLHDQHESNCFPGQKHLKRVVVFSFGGLSVPCVILNGKQRAKEACVWISADSTCVIPLRFCVAIINLSRQYNYMLSPMSLPSESLNTGWSWRYRYLHEYLK